MHVEARGGGAAADDLAGEGLGSCGVAALGGVADLFFFFFFGLCCWKEGVEKRLSFFFWFSSVSPFSARSKAACPKEERKKRKNQSSHVLLRQLLLPGQVPDLPLHAPLLAPELRLPLPDEVLGVRGLFEVVQDFAKHGLGTKKELRFV